VYVDDHHREVAWQHWISKVTNDVTVLLLLLLLMSSRYPGVR